MGALAIIAAPIISQLIYGIWKILGGFSWFDYSKEFICCIPLTKRCIVQAIFDRYWHASSGVNNGAVEYSRRRSGACQLNLFGIILSVPSALLFSILALLYHDASWKGVILSGAFTLTSIIFYLHLRIESYELREIQRFYLEARKSEIENEIKQALRGHYGTNDDTGDKTQLGIMKIAESCKSISKSLEGRNNDKQ